MRLNTSREIGVIFIYIFAFGISDFLVKKYMVLNSSYIMYYIGIGLVGLFLILNNDFQYEYFNSKKGQRKQCS